jgi:hypothetical protein
VYRAPGAVVVMESRSAAMPLAHTKVQQRSGGSAFLPHDKAKQQQIPRAKQLARGMTVSS